MAFGNPTTYVPLKTYAPMPSVAPKLSASRIKGLQSCSWEFFCSACLKLPERVWSKTFVGSLCHIILECLAKNNPKRKEYYDTIIKTGTYKSVKSIHILVNNFKRKNPQMEDKHSDDLDDLLAVALKHDFFFTGAKKVLPPEWKFELVVGGAKIKGFLDRLAFYDGYAVIRDYKTQKDRFTESELENNIQAAIYQLAVKEVFGVSARVEFILLRHAGNKKDPLKHVQVVEPYSPEQLSGLVSYVSHLNGEFEKFNIERARLNLRAIKDKGFCFNVCGYRLPYKYFALTKDGKLLKTSKSAIQAADGETVTEHFYSGCPYFFSSEGKARNYS